MPIAHVFEMQRHAGERQPAHTALLVDPEDARREQRDALLAQHPLRETVGLVRLGRRELSELLDRERSIGPPHDGERCAAGRDLARLQSA